jgi:hypothetical protein
LHKAESKFEDKGDNISKRVIERRKKTLPPPFERLLHKAFLNLPASPIPVAKEVLH